MVGRNKAGLPFPAALEGVSWRVYHFLSARRVNVIREWLDAERVPSELRGKFQLQIDILEQSGPKLVPGFISDGPVAKDIYKAKIKGKMQLRPRLCHGPMGQFEFTFLFGAIERDKKDIPPHCNVSAQENRKILIADQTRRKRERITG